MPYAYAPFGTVTQRVETLPENWRSVSGLNRLSDPELLALKWFPVVDVKPVLDSYEEYGTPTLEVQAAQVVYTYPVVKPTLDDLQRYRKREFKAELKARIYDLKDMEDIVIMLITANVPGAFQTKIAALSAAYEAAVTAINAATTRAEVRAVTVTWPD